MTVCSGSGTQTRDNVVLRCPGSLEMDSTRFDRIAAALTGETGRRDTLRLLGASLLGVGGLAVLGVAEGDGARMPTPGT